MHAMAGSLLESLLSGSEETDGVILRDTAEHNGRLLLKCFVCQWAQRFSAVHLFLFDAHPQAWLNGLPAALQQRIVVHDGFSDPLGWNGSSGLLSNASVQVFSELIGPGLSKSAVLLDSLSTLVLHQGVPKMCRLVHHLGTKAASLLCLLHDDIHEDHVISRLCHVIPTTILVRPVQPELATEYCGKCSVTHQKKSGKVLKKTEWYSVGENFTVNATEAASLSSLVNREEEKAPDLTANLTFDLTLSVKEEQDRARVVLPYTYSSEKKSAHLQVGAGKIFYQPDDADDFDESDPDDDLDI